MTNEQLINKFFEAIPSYADEGQLENYCAKECAKIAIDFAIEQLKETESNFSSGQNHIVNKQIQFLEKQKEELTKTTRRYCTS